MINNGTETNSVRPLENHLLTINRDDNRSCESCTKNIDMFKVAPRICMAIILLISYNVWRVRVKYEL